jgi:hypothetical protein
MLDLCFNTEFNISRVANFDRKQTIVVKPVEKEWFTTNKMIILNSTAFSPTYSSCLFLCEWCAMKVHLYYSIIGEG